MTEHVHEWTIDWDCQRNEYVMCECGETMPPDDAEARLNATERLSAAEARAISDGIFGEWGVIEETLIAYANILEGKDD